MIKIQAKSSIPTAYGRFWMMAFAENENDWMPHIAIVSEKIDFSQTVNVRFHSECITGEVFHSRKCECGQQLDTAMKYINEHSGVIIYLRQEGRNIGIINKLKAYALQEKGLDTVQANLQLGFPADDRDFSIAIDILNLLKVKSVNLITNNPLKIKAVENSNIKLINRIPIQIEATEESKDYLNVKEAYFGHYLDKKK